MIKVLLLEDDPVISKEIKDYLSKHDIACTPAFDGELFLRTYKAGFDVFILDINVPKINGLDVCNTVRQDDKQTPILMLTAYDQIADKVDAFAKGADDYLVKPFHPEELLARILALVRRRSSPQTEQAIFVIDDLEIDRDKKVVRRAGQEIALTPKEFKLLVMLAEANGRVLSKGSIAEGLWDYHIETTQNTIEVYINFLRNKIDKHAANKLIHTKVGFGYYLKAQ